MLTLLKKDEWINELHRLMELKPRIVELGMSQDEQSVIVYKNEFGTIAVSENSFKFPEEAELAIQFCTVHTKRILGHDFKSVEDMPIDMLYAWNGAEADQWFWANEEGDELIFWVPPGGDEPARLDIFEARNDGSNMVWQSWKMTDDELM